MKILVYGAGNLGSLYAARLIESGQDVAILARGDRLARICDHGIELENTITGEKTTTPIETVERLDRKTSMTWCWSFCQSSLLLRCCRF